MMCLLCLGGLFFLKETLVAKKLDESSSSDLYLDKEEIEKEEESNGKLKKKEVPYGHLLCYGYIVKKGKKLWKEVRPLFRVKIIVSMFIFGMAPFALISAAEVKRKMYIQFV